MNKPKNSDPEGRREGDYLNSPSVIRWHFVPVAQQGLEVLPATFNEKLPIIYANIRV